MMRLLALAVHAWLTTAGHTERADRPLAQTSRLYSSPVKVLAHACKR